MKYIFSAILLFLSNFTFAVCNTSTLKESTPNTEFIVDNVSHTVTHLKTGLMWKQCSEGLSTTTIACDTGAATTGTWAQSLKLANSSAFATFTDWRLPNIKELGSILELSCIPSINSSIFINTVSKPYWTSTPVIINGAIAANTLVWLMNFGAGGAYRGDISSITAYTRLVRGGR
ncbi:MAG: DUF1566 domain-containing protein [Gammaproteobacteria bacterium]